MCSKSPRLGINHNINILVMIAEQEVDTPSNFQHAHILSHYQLP